MCHPVVSASLCMVQNHCFQFIIVLRYSHRLFPVRTGTCFKDGSFKSFKRQSRVLYQQYLWGALGNFSLPVYSCENFDLWRFLLVLVSICSVDFNENLEYICYSCVPDNNVLRSNKRYVQSSISDLSPSKYIG